MGQASRYPLCATMCYMNGPSEHVGVRELRQNLSVYLRKVLKGATLEVTERGRPVALLVPIPPSDRPVDQLVASGRARASERSLYELLPPKGRTSLRLSQALKEERAERL